MRIHGDINICRRNDAGLKSNYREYEHILSEDFGHICGYCGKSEMVTTKGFEIDHFVPNKVDPARKSDYYNLVYSCFTCNRKKSGKWPTENKNIHNNGVTGFVDPATNEYDLHLKRDTFGKIVHTTDVGKYMCDIAFKFNHRPTQEIWKYMQIKLKLNILQNMLKQQREKMSNKDLEDHIKLASAVDELQQHLFNAKE